jgi:hypothetical protein
MKPGRMTQLSQLTGLIYQARQSDMQALKAEETRVLAALDALEESRRATGIADHEDHLRKGVGADILWQGWLDSRQRALTMELARLRARKEPIAYHLRKAFGRDRVARALVEQESQAARKRLRKTDP